MPGSNFLVLKVVLNAFGFDLSSWVGIGVYLVICPLPPAFFV